jgi:hypothetical protein
MYLVDGLASIFNLLKPSIEGTIFLFNLYQCWLARVKLARLGVWLNGLPDSHRALGPATDR